MTMRTRTFVAGIVTVFIGLPILLITGWVFFRSVFVPSVPFELHSAIEAGDIREVARCLADGADPNYQFYPKNPCLGYRPLHLACEKGQLEIARLLVQSGADADGMNNEGETPLFRVTYCPRDKPQRLECFRYILAHSSSPAHRDHAGNSALHRMSGRSELEFVKLLLKAGVNVNQRGSHGWTPLHCVASDSTPTLTEVDSKGRVIRFRDYRPMSIAVFNILLDAGADPHLLDESGYSPIDIARRSGRKDLLEELEKRGITCTEGKGCCGPGDLQALDDGETNPKK